MDFKKLLTNPYVLAAAGGAAGYYFKGRHTSGKGKYLWPAGGVATGYVAGLALQRVLYPPSLPAETVPREIKSSEEYLVDLDAEDTLQTAAGVPDGMPPAATVEEPPEDLGSLGGDTLGSMGLSDVEIDDLAN